MRTCAVREPHTSECVGPAFAERCRKYDTAQTLRTDPRGSQAIVLPAPPAFARAVCAAHTMPVGYACARARVLPLVGTQRARLRVGWLGYHFGRTVRTLNPAKSRTRTAPPLS